MLIFIFLVQFNLTAQIEVASGDIPPYNPQILIEDVLLGEGVEILNIVYEGKDEAVGYFINGLNEIGLEEGIVLTTGVATTSGADIGIVEEGNIQASANNNSGATDLDIELLAEGEEIFNLAKYTITFVPSSDQMSFNYVFASEEYPEFGCTPYNDFFGFFISGPGFNGIYENNAENIALIPGTNMPVAINNVHPQNPTNPLCTPVFEEFFNDNDGTSNFPVYDGYLDVFTANATVVPCETYTIKLVIADISDAQRDSGVFFEAKSFNSNGIDVSANSNSLDGTLIEGCTDGSFLIEIPEPALADISIDYNMIGDAINGIDYELVTENIFIPTGQTSVNIPIIPIVDTDNEGLESVGIDIQINNCTRDTFYLYLRDPELETPDLGIDQEICIGESVSLDGSITVTTLSPETYSSTSSPVIVLGPIGSLPPTPAFMDIDIAGFLPLDLNPGLIQSVCMNIDHSMVADLDIYLYSPGGQFIPLTSDNGDDGNNYSNTCFSPTAADDITFGMQFAPASAAPFTGTFQPEGNWENLYFGDSPVNGTWRLMAIDDESGFTGAIQDWSITLNQSYDVAYAWSPTAGLSCTDCPNPIATPNETTTYTLTITDTYGCSTSDDITITVIDAYDAPSINCSDVSTSTITFDWNMIDFATSYEVSVEGAAWETPNNGLNSHIITGLTVGQMISIEVRATGACSAMIGSTTCQTLDCTGFTINVDSDSPSCAGGDNGVITVTSGGDNLPHTYTLDFDNVETLIGTWNNLPAGFYNVTIEDAIGCTESFPVPVNDSTPVTSSVVLNNNINCENSSASATASGMGGMPIFTYEWSNGLMTNELITETEGWYYVTVSDFLMCETIDSVLILNEGMLEVTATANSICPNSTDGIATVNLISGTEPLTYQWDANANGQTTADAINLMAGEYFVTVTSADNCEQIVSATVNSHPEMMLDISSTDATCGNADGNALITVINPVNNLNYEWSTDPVQNSIQATGLLAGEYFVTVTDENNCEAILSTTISTPSSIVLDVINTTDASCNLATDGTVSLSVTGGTVPLSYSLNNQIQDNGNYSNLGAGDYSIIVTDAQGCSTNFDFSITEPTAIVSIENIANHISCDQPTAMASFDVSGGTAPFTYLWSNAQTDPVLSTTIAGEYYVTITDNTTCIHLDTLTIIQGVILTISTSTEPICEGQNNGSATVSVDSGTEPYNYIWDTSTGNQITPTANNLSVGDYQVTVTDSNNCEEIATVSITANPSLNLTISSTEADCNGAADGTATVIANGGTAPFSYLWDDQNMQTTPTAIDLLPGLYNVTVSDSNGCSAIETINVLTPSQLAIDDLSSTAVSCAGGNDGTATVLVSGGSGGFTYNWSGTTQNDAVITNLGAGDYMVSISDDEGCEIIGTITVDDGADISVSSSVTDVVCANDNNGSIDLTVSGGQAPYFFEWSNLATTEDIDNLGAGNFDYTITDSNGCETTGLETVNTTSPIEVELDVNMVVCFGENSGSITSTIQGGLPPYSYQWSTGATTPNIENIATGTYDVIITDANNCGIFATADITEPALFEGEVEMVEPLCFGDTNGSLLLNPIGGNAGFQYSIDGINYQDEALFEGLSSQNYTIYIQDATGCVFEDDVFLNQPFDLTVELGDDLKTTLGERIFVEALLGGGTGEVSFDWNSAEFIELSCLDCFNPYALVNNFGEVSVIVTDENGCEAEDLIFIDVDKTHRLFVPNVFSPDQDGVNDLFMPYSRPETFIEKFVIFDRWGNRIYENGQFFTVDQIGWDGKYKNQYVDTGVYVWYIEAVFIDGENVLFKGDVTVVK